MADELRLLILICLPEKETGVQKCVCNSNCHCFCSALPLAQDIVKRKLNILIDHIILTTKLDPILEHFATKPPKSPHMDVCACVSPFPSERHRCNSILIWCRSEEPPSRQRKSCACVVYYLHKVKPTLNALNHKWAGPCPGLSSFYQEDNFLSHAPMAKTTHFDKEVKLSETAYLLTSLGLATQEEINVSVLC